MRGGGGKLGFLLRLNTRLTQSVVVDLTQPGQQARRVHDPAEEPGPAVLEELGEAVVRHEERGRVVLASDELLHRCYFYNIKTPADTKHER